MSVTIVVPKRTGKKHREKLHLKKCSFPKCKNVFMGTGHSRYCTIHRHRKYRKIIDASKIAAKKAEEEARNPNQIINHSYTNTVIVVQKCKLEGCFNEFEIKIFPNVFCYPKYCENHRNSWKREFFLNKNKDK